jgi:PTH1 family peptidyl-tRNA hydrolase
VRTRHNAGFIVVDALAGQLGVGGAWRTKDGARQVVDRDHGVILVEPLSYMNLSGEPTQRIAAWHKVPPDQILVIVDDLDLPFGKLRMRERGSSGGHNGLKSLIGHFGPDFPRLRIGIGRDGTTEAIDRVLGTFSPDEAAKLPAVVDACVRGVRLWLEGPTVMAINYVNSFTLEV